MLTAPVNYVTTVVDESVTRQSKWKMCFEIAQVGFFVFVASDMAAKCINIRADTNTNNTLVCEQLHLPCPGCMLIKCFTVKSSSGLSDKVVVILSDIYQSRGRFNCETFN